MTRRTVLFSVVLVLGTCLRLAGVTRPIDRAGFLWREADLASIARNFDREGMNLLNPRVDWRGDGPGYAEMEFPIYPWAMAWAHRATGADLALAGRALAFGFSLVSLGVFVRLARHLLPWRGALAAVTFFALSPLVIDVSHLVLADGLTFMLSLIAVHAFVLWIDEEWAASYWIALAATVAAILAKATAAQIGLLFAVLAIEKYGRNVLAQGRLWLFAAASVVIPLPWYLHSHTFWRTYGNSLGVSNEYHWVGLDVFTNPHFLGGIGKLELLHVWMPTTIVLVLIAWIYGRGSRAVTVGFAWLAVVAIYYLITCRTSAGIWAVYYHVVSAPAVALLVGAAIAALLPEPGQAARRTPRAGTAAAWIGGVSLVLTFLLQLRLDYAGISDRTPDALYLCAARFAPSIPPGALIVASGDRCIGPAGHPTAGNKPYFFYWLDRKGFNICEEDQSIDTLTALAGRGATFFIAETSALRKAPGFASEVRSVYPVVDECPGALLLRLTSQPARPESWGRLSGTPRSAP